MCIVRPFRSLSVARARVRIDSGLDKQKYAQTVVSDADRPRLRGEEKRFYTVWTKADTPFLGSSRDPKRARVKIKAVRRAVHSVATRQWLENACGLFRARSLSLAWSAKQRSPCCYLITLEDT